MCPAVVQDPHLGEGDVYYGDGGPDKVYGVDGVLDVMVEVPQRTARGPSSGQVWLVSMAWCGDGRGSCRWFHRRMFMLVGMPVWWSTQRGHVLRARCAAWRRMVVTSRTSGEWLWVMRVAIWPMWNSPRS